MDTFLQWLRVGIFLLVVRWGLQSVLVGLLVWHAYLVRWGLRTTQNANAQEWRRLVSRDVILLLVCIQVAWYYQYDLIVLITCCSGALDRMSHLLAFAQWVIAQESRA